MLIIIHSHKEEPIKYTSKRKLVVILLSYENYYAVRNNWLSVDEKKNHSEIHKLIYHKPVRNLFYEFIISCVWPYIKQGHTMETFRNNVEVN